MHLTSLFLDTLLYQLDFPYGRDVLMSHITFNLAF